MTCRSCAQEIADKAIVCYRCGAPTASPPVLSAAPRRSRPGLIWLVVIAAVLAAAAYLVLGGRAGF